MTRILLFTATIALGSAIVSGQVYLPEGMKDGGVVAADSSFMIGDRLKTILAAFLRGRDCSKCYIEMYVDQQTPDLTVFTLRMRDIYPGYIERQPLPLFIICIHGIAVHVYSGLEKYFQRGKPLAERIVPSTWKDCKGSTLSVQDSAGVIRFGGIGFPWDIFYPEVIAIPKADSSRVR